MSEAFGPAALRLYGLAARLLGWKPPEFWGATPAELADALAPLQAPASLDRQDLHRMMEQDDGPVRN